MRPSPAWILAVACGCALEAAAACPTEDWPASRRERLIAAGFELQPGERETLARELPDCLGEADPRVRDEFALAALTHWLRGAALEAPLRREIGARLLALLVDPQDASGLRRPFVAIALAELVRADRLAPDYDQARHDAFLAAALGYLDGIDDYRAFDPREGWRHAVAHAADLALQLGLHPHTDAGARAALLAALTRRIAPADAPGYAHGEAERLARAVHFLHAHDAQSAEATGAWLDRLVDPSPWPDWSHSYRSLAGLARRHNTLAFLHALGFAARANGQGERSERIDAAITAILRAG